MVQTQAVCSRSQACILVSAPWQAPNSQLRSDWVRTETSHLRIILRNPGLRNQWEMREVTDSAQIQCVNLYGVSNCVQNNIPGGL